MNEDGIKKLAELLHLDDYKKLLEPVEKDGKKGEDIKMANRMITDNERNAARILYGEMCDMKKLNKGFWIGLVICIIAAAASLAFKKYRSW